VDVGVLEDVEDGVRIAETYRSTKTMTDEGFRDLLRRAVLATNVNDQLFASEDGAREFTRALAWYLAQNVDDPPATHDARDSRPYAAALLDEQMAKPKKNEVPILRNKDRWPSFVRWSRYLGFAESLPMPSAGLPLIQPDPTEAVRRVLASSTEPRKGKESELVEYVRILSEALQVLDGGQYRQEVEARMAQAPLPPGGEGALSAPLSLALFRLRAEGVVTLVDKADARHARVLAVTAAEPQRCSHVKLVRRP
jgi:hypothetical protein